MTKRKGWRPVVTVALVALTPLMGWLWVGVVEVLTLTDATQDNHITAAFRIALDEAPQLVLVLAVVLTLLYSGLFFLMLGHIYHRWGPERKS